MDWPVALTLVHLQHKHQQDQKQQRQQYQGICSNSLNKGSSGPGSTAASARRSSQQQRASLHGRHSLSSGLTKGRGAVGSSSLDAVTPLLPVPSESVYLQVSRS